MANTASASSVARRRNGVQPQKSQVSRLHITLPDSLKGRLEQITEDSHSTSVAEVLRNSLTVYAAMLDAHKQGKHVIIQNADGSERERLRLFI